MTDPKEVADLGARLDRFLSGNFYAPPVIREALEASFKTLETLSSELERVKGERDAALAQMKEESHEAFLCRNKVGQQKETMLEAAAALNETLARAERAEASLGVAVKALRNMPCPRPRNHRPDQFDAGDCFDAGECGCVAARPLASIQAKGE